MRQYTKADRDKLGALLDIANVPPGNMRSQLRRAYTVQLGFYTEMHRMTMALNEFLEQIVSPTVADFETTVHVYVAMFVFKTYLNWHYKDINPSIPNRYPAIEGWVNAYEDLWTTTTNLLASVLSKMLSACVLTHPTELTHSDYLEFAGDYFNTYMQEYFTAYSSFFLRFGYPLESYQVEIKKQLPPNLHNAIIRVGLPLDGKETRSIESVFPMSPPSCDFPEEGEEDVNCQRLTYHGRPLAIDYHKYESDSLERASLERASLERNSLERIDSSDELCTRTLQCPVDNG